MKCAPLSRSCPSNGAYRIRRGLVYGGLLLAWAPAIAGPSGFSYEALVALINDRGLTQINQVLAALPTELLSNYTLVYASRSVQGASYENPRAILFGRDAKFVMTFNGHPSQTKYQELEILQYRDDTEMFELRSVSFTDGVRLSEKNPGACLTCHGADPGPIWGSYPYASQDQDHWPGVFGSTHDAPRLVVNERTAFERFRHAAARHSRYRHLQRSHPGSAWFPYGNGPHEHQFRPNNRLGNLLARLNARRLARRIRESPWFQRHRDLSLAWLLGCQRAQAPAFGQRVQQHFRERYDERAYPHYYRQLVRLEAANRTAFMLEKLLTGPDVQTWGLDVAIPPDGARFSTGIVTIDQLVAARIVADIAAQEPHWRVFYSPATARDLYNTFRARYYEENVAPGGVGATYDDLGLYYDVHKARAACDALAGPASGAG